MIIARFMMAVTVYAAVVAYGVISWKKLNRKEAWVYGLFLLATVYPTVQFVTSEYGPNLVHWIKWAIDQPASQLVKWIGK